jgi:hypothetical protein
MVLHSWNKISSYCFELPFFRCFLVVGFAFSAPSFACREALEMLGRLETETLNSPTFVLNRGWQAVELVRDQVGRYSNEPLEGYQVLAPSASPHRVDTLTKAWVKAAEKELTSEFGTHERGFLRGAKDQIFVQLQSASGTSLIANILAPQKGMSIRRAFWKIRTFFKKKYPEYNRIFVDLNGESPLNRLARVLHDRTGLFLELSEPPNSSIDEVRGVIHFSQSRFQDDASFWETFAQIVHFIEEHKVERRLIVDPSIDDLKVKAVWRTVPQGNVVNLKEFIGLDIEAHYLMHADFVASGIVPRETLFPFVGPVKQHVSRIDQYTDRFGVLSEPLRAEVQAQLDLTENNYRRPEKRRDYSVSLILLDHTTDSVSRFAWDSEELRALHARANQIERPKQPRPGPLATLVVLQASTDPIPLDKRSLHVARDMIQEWRVPFGPDKLNVELLNVWLDPDSTSPLALHRPLNIYSEENRPSRLLDLGLGKKLNEELGLQ